MTDEEIVFELTKVALKELIKSCGEANLHYKEYAQEQIGKSAANIAAEAYQQIQVHLRGYR